MINLINITSNTFVVFSFLGAFALTYYLIPKIIKVVNHKELMEHPNQRSSHVHLTPTFGGISFFMVLIFTLMLIQPTDENNISLNLIAALTVFLFTGLKDDLVVISHRSKLFGQISAIIIFLFNTDFYKINFQGLLGMYEFDPIVGFFIVGFIMLSIINSFNLIDGIDGLSASITITVLIWYGLIFFTLNETFYFSLCVTLVGSLLAFLRFNFSSKKKIFMGDTGSLIIGFIVSVLTIKFLTLNSIELSSLNVIPSNAVFVAVSILIFPIIDTSRVLLVRAKNKNHLLLADRNHIHHLLLDLGYSHKKSSFLIAIISVVLSVILVYSTALIKNTWYITALFLLIFFLLFVLLFYLSKSKKE